MTSPQRRRLKRDLTILILIGLGGFVLVALLLRWAFLP
jgi:hypothetical protein